MQSYQIISADELNKMEMEIGTIYCKVCGEPTILENVSTHNCVLRHVCLACKNGMPVGDYITPQVIGKGHKINPTVIEEYNNLEDQYLDDLMFGEYDYND